MLRRLGLRPGGGTHQDVRARASALGLDTSHFAAARRRTWTEAALREAAAASRGLAELVARLGLAPTSAARRRVARELRARAIDAAHFAPPRAGGSRAAWTPAELRAAVAASTSFAGVLRRLGLVPAGGNYAPVQRRVRELGLDTSHFTGRGWNAGLGFRPAPPAPLADVLVPNRPVSTHALKQRLFRAGLKRPACELCGWAARAPDGRVPVELDHANGDPTDNRLEICASSAPTATACSRHTAA